MAFDTANYQEQFEDARRRAEQAIDPIESDAWMRIASKWLKRLARAERQDLTEVLAHRSSPPLNTYET